MKKPHTPTLAEIQAGAKRAAARFETWPEWKKEISMPSQKVEALQVGWDNHQAKVWEDGVTIEVKYTAYDDNCCCGECWPSSMGYTEETDLDLTRTDIIALAKAMKITAEELT